jgi:hypothetical protein
MGTIAELVPGAQVHIVDGGHFSLDTAAYEIAARVCEFMEIPKESVAERISPRRRNHGNCNDDNPPAFASVRT